MSKCDISIQLDQPGRTFHGGDEVSGTVHIDVNRNVRCHGLVVEHFWETHGRGNTDRGEKQQLVFQPGDLRAGDTLNQRFQFTAPHGPPTYHGHYLNIDHYIHVRVDIPWAIDPKKQIEYILQPSGNSYKELSNPHEKAVRTLQWEQYGLPAAIVCLVLGLICIFPFGIVLIPVGLVLLFFSLRKSMAERKLGPVEFDFPKRELAPGESAPLRLSFTPRKRATVKSIVATLTGNEQCTSGSGTNTTTHTHKLAEHKKRLLEATELSPGTPVVCESSVTIPPKAPFSFSANDNKISWTITVHIDIPGWPDWVEKIPLTVSPLGEGGADKTTSAQTFEAAPPLPPHAPATDDMEREIPTVEAALAPASVPIEPPPEPIDQPKSARDLRSLLDRIMKADRFGSAREDLVTANLDEAFQFQIDIDSVGRTFGAFFDEQYRNGRTIRGKLMGTDHMLETQFDENRNEELDRLSTNDHISVVAVPIKWDSTFERLQMREA